MLLGLHHVTALAGSAQQNLDFYSGFLGLRLVKRTVNFDDPATHHFYYGGARGAPGTLVTFFPWGRFRATRKGTGQAIAVAFAAPERLIEHSQNQSRDRAVSETRFGETILTISDPDGIAMEMVVASREESILHSVTLCETELNRSAEFLGFLGFESLGSEGGRPGNRARFRLPGQSGFVDLLHQPEAERGKTSVGTIHHVAFAVADEATQLEWRERLIAHGVKVSAVKDRHYFHSIYFREPGGVLFEIATLGPGFLIDESESELGSRLCLPPWLESIRESVEQRLPPVRLPEELHEHH